MGSGGSLEANASLVEGNENIQPQKEDMASLEVSHGGFLLCTCSGKRANVTMGRGFSFLQSCLVEGDLLRKVPSIILSKYSVSGTNF